MTVLRAAGLRWARSSLEGGLRLSSFVLGCAGEFADWTVLTAPASATEREGFRLDEGGVTRVSSSSAVLVRGVSALGLERPLLIVEDDLARATDPVIQSRSGDTFRCGGPVYHRTRCIEEPDALRRFLDTSASAYPLNAFLLDDRGADLLPSETEPGDGDFRRLARHTALVIVSALDGEAFLLWPRKTVADELRAWISEER